VPTYSSHCVREDETFLFGLAHLDRHLAHGVHHRANLAVNGQKKLVLDFLTDGIIQCSFVAIQAASSVQSVLKAGCRMISRLVSSARYFLFAAERITAEMSIVQALTRNDTTPWLMLRSNCDIVNGVALSGMEAYTQCRSLIHVLCTLKGRAWEGQETTNRKRRIPDKSHGSHKER